MRLFECGTLVPGCAWHTRADDDAEVVRRTVEHMRSAHGETVIRENMIENIKARLKRFMQRLGGSTSTTPASPQQTAGHPAE